MMMMMMMMMMTMFSVDDDDDDDVFVDDVFAAASCSCVTRMPTRFTRVFDAYAAPGPPVADDALPRHDAAHFWHDSVCAGGWCVVIPRRRDVT